MNLVLSGCSVRMSTWKLELSVSGASHASGRVKDLIALKLS